MIGIYKITNKLNNKAYIGQSIHCGKRLDEHCHGNQLIDEVIQLEGIENFNFEILKQVEKSELNLWEDYYIDKFNTLFPNGYNKRWNCSEKRRKEFCSEIEKTLIAKDKIKSQDNFLLEEVPFIPFKVYFYLLSMATYQDAHNTILKLMPINQIKLALHMHPITIKKNLVFLKDNNLLIDKEKHQIVLKDILPNLIKQKILNDKLYLSLSERQLKIYLFIKLNPSHILTLKEIRDYLKLSKDVKNNFAIKEDLQILQSQNLIDYPEILTSTNLNTQSITYKF